MRLKSNYSGQFYSYFKVIAFWFMFIFNNAHSQTPPGLIQGGWLWTSDKNSLCYVTLTAWNDSKHIHIWMFLHFKHWTRFDKVCWYFVQYFYIQAITEIYVNRFWIVEILHSKIFLHDSWVVIFLSMKTSFQTNYQLIHIKGPAHTYSNGTRIKRISWRYQMNARV